MEIDPDPLIGGWIGDPLECFDAEEFVVTMSDVFPHAVVGRNGKDELWARLSVVALENAKRGRREGKERKLLRRGRKVLYVLLPVGLLFHNVVNINLSSEY